MIFSTAFAFIGIVASTSPWHLVWGDEFSKNGAPDAAKWSPETGYIRNHEMQFYTDRRLENARVEKGHLVIEAHKDNFEGHPVTSASLTTFGKFEFKYGRVEVRAKIPTGKGTWPAIWTLGTDIAKVGWPKCGEIDIMENVGFNPDTTVWTVHTSKPGTYDHVSSGHSEVTPKPYADFHVYAIEWSRDQIEFFYDKESKFVFRRSEHPDMEWNFDAPHYLILNLAIGGDWGGQQGVSDSIFPSRYEIDYVRIFQKKD